MAGAVTTAVIVVAIGAAIMVAGMAVVAAGTVVAVAAADGTAVVAGTANWETPDIFNRR